MSSREPDAPSEPPEGEEHAAVPRFLGRLRYTDADRAAVAQQLAEGGAPEEEIAEALRSGTLGALALDLALRPPGALVSLRDAAGRAGLSLEEAVTLWRALGFATPSDGSVRLTSAEATTLELLMDLGREVVGEERILGFARVLGWATAVLGEALVDAFRVQVELPRLGSGGSYAEIVEDYTRLAAASFPTFVEGLGVLTRAHMLRVSRGAWSPDEQLSAVTREHTIGFADLVGYTGHSRTLSTTDLALAIGRFEVQVTEVVSHFGGRLVKFIGDEAMFIVEDPATGCELALALVDRFAADPRLPPLRVGLAAGPTVALHGDYYGEVVNLAARLSTVGEPSEIVVSDSVASRVPEGVVFERVPELALKGFDAPISGFRLLRARAH